MIDLYYWPTPNGWKISIMLEECGLPYNLVPVNIGTGEQFNQSLEKANRVVDYLELAELMCLDALHRAESCGGHFREEYQTGDGEALRDDEHFAYVAAWQHAGDAAEPRLHKEALEYENVKLATRSYK